MACIDCCASKTSLSDDLNGGHLRRLISHSDHESRWNCSTTQYVNPYQVLELRRDATPSEIVQSYRQLALLHHPGRGGSTSPDERSRRIQCFEVLSACYETLMHQDSRRRYDIRLKQLERNRLAGLAVSSSGTSHATSDATSGARGRLLSNSLLEQEQCPSPAISTQTSQMSRNRGVLIRHLTKEEDAVPGLAHSSSSETSTPSKRQPAAPASNSSADKSPSHPAGCSPNFFCAPALTGTLSANNFGAKSKSLIVGDSSGSRSSQEEPEIHFSETTVDRLFGGPLSHLHRARNFEPFSDPFDVFERVFGSPVFPRVTLVDDTIVERRFNQKGFTNQSNDMAVAVRSPWNHKPAWTGTAHKDPDSDTTVFVSSRVFGDRKITRTETVHVVPETGKATSEVKVEGEYLFDKNVDSSGNDHAGSCDWITCHRPRNDDDTDGPQEVTDRKLDDATAEFCEDFQCVYGNAMEGFYHWNKDLYGACTGYMGCTD